MNPIHFTVDLYEHEGLGLIIACLSGVNYTNQVAGYACLHPELEGVYIPLPASGVGKLESYFTGPKWNGRCYEAIDEETADFVDAILAELGLGSCLRVDRDRFAESWEAWIRVKVGMNSVHWLGLNQGDGVLTWENSD